MHLGEALRTGIARLEAAGVGSPRLNAEILLMFVLACDRAYLYAHPERELTAGEQERYDLALLERSRGVPSQYITGHQEFWGLDFLVSPAVLIPRPETEHLVEAVLEIVSQQSPRKEHLRIVDVGTGSGCIALALAHELPQAEIYAVESSPAALEIARANAARLARENRVTFHEGDLLSGSGWRGFDFVVSNPPYVGESESDRVQREVRRFEPHQAIFGGEQGLDVYRRLIPQAKQALAAGGWLVMEIGYSQQSAIGQLLSGWAAVQFRNDLQGIPRVAIAQNL